MSTRGEQEAFIQTEQWSPAEQFSRLADVDLKGAAQTVTHIAHTQDAEESLEELGAV